MKIENEEPAFSARIDSNPGARLLGAARELFSEQGYQVAGINEIIARSGTSKKSFYKYFPGKQKLGEAYLQAERDEQFRMLHQLMQRHRDNYRAFVRTWIYTLKKGVGCEDYQGCPFANTAAQALKEFGEPIGAIMQEWHERLTEYLTGCDLALNRKAARRLSGLMLMQYEGAIQMWRLTGDVKYFDLCEEALCGLAGVSYK